MRTKFFIVSIIAVLVVFTSFGAFAVKPPQPPEGDTVLSADIKEADGTTGQDTNSGSGVKTDHLQNEAVTTPKIADGAVTNAKIQGKISADKLESPSNIITVAQSGGDYTSITEALDAISPSESNPYVIKIAPGTYTDAANGGSEIFPIIIKPYVSLIGSGANNTKIYQSDSAAPGYHVFEGDADGVLIDGLTCQSAYGSGLLLYSSTGKDITLRNSTFHGRYAYAATVFGCQSVNVDNCEFTGSEGLAVGMPNLSEPATIIITNSRFIDLANGEDNGFDLWGHGYGNVFISNSIFRGFIYSITASSTTGPTNVIINDVDADRSFLLDCRLSSVLVTNSRIGVSDQGVSIYTYNDLEDVVKVATTMIEGTFPPSIKLFQCFDGNLDPVTNP